MAVNIHIKLDEIEGEASDPKFPKAITVVGYHWAVSQPANANFKYASPTAQDLTFIKHVDKATTQLLFALAKKKVIGKAVLTLTKAGGKPLDFLVITLEKVMVSSIRTSCAEGEGEYTEEIGLSFGRITKEYYTQDAKGVGKATGSVTVDFSPPE